MAQVNKQKRSFNPFQHEERAQVNKNTFDLSHDVKTTFKMGWFTPIMVMDTLPGDQFKIRTEVMMRFAPLILPLMHRVEMRLDYFYCPNRILWPKPNGWEDFIVGEDVEWAYSTVRSTDMVTGTLWEYLGIPAWNNDSFQYKINAFPMAAYAKIWDEYIRNSQIQDEVFEPLVEGENAYYAWGPGKFATRPQLVLWGKDFYTAALPMPQMGEDVLIPMLAEGKRGASQYYREDGGVMAAGPANWLGAGPPQHSVLADSGNEESYLDVQESAANIRDLRLAVKLQEWLEKLNRTGKRYRDYLKGFFASDPSPLQIDDPVYLGSAKSTVVISEVLQTAQTETAGGENPLGAYAGQALAFSDGKFISYTCSEHGWIMAMISVVPRTSYFQGLHKKWTRETYLDYAFPQFAGIGDQEILNKEIYHQNNDGHEIFGYIPRYSEYRWENDMIAGQMRTTFLDFHLGRNFDTTPALNSEFISCTPRVQDVFVLPDPTEHECYAHLFNNVTVSRNLPRYGIPQL